MNRHTNQNMCDSYIFSWGIYAWWKRRLSSAKGWYMKSQIEKYFRTKLDIYQVLKYNKKYPTILTG